MLRVCVASDAPWDSLLAPPSVKWVRVRLHNSLHPVDSMLRTGALRAPIHLHFPHLRLPAFLLPSSCLSSTFKLQIVLQPQHHHQHWVHVSINIRSENLQQRWSTCPASCWSFDEKCIHARARAQSYRPLVPSNTSCTGTLTAVGS